MRVIQKNVDSQQIKEKPSVRALRVLREKMEAFRGSRGMGIEGRLRGWGGERDED